MNWSKLLLAVCNLAALQACATLPAFDPVVGMSCAERLAGNFAQFDSTLETEAGRKFPVTVFHPNRPGTYPLLAFSHGAFAAPDRYEAMLRPMAAAGFVVIAPMHVDSEEMPKPVMPSQDQAWTTRIEDFRLTLAPPDRVREELARAGIRIAEGRKVAMGHSFGAVIAQVSGGALAREPDGSRLSRLDPELDAVIAWSPPPALPQMIDAEGWRAMRTPSLTITGTADVLPGFVEDWTLRKASFENAPAGSRAIWIGTGIDHYFGGMFGREKPAAEHATRLFARALSRILHFADGALGNPAPCDAGASVDGEVYLEG